MKSGENGRVKTNFIYRYLQNSNATFRFTYG